MNMDPPPLPGLGGTGYQLKQMVGGVTHPNTQGKEWKMQILRYSRNLGK